MINCTYQWISSFAPSGSVIESINEKDILNGTLDSKQSLLVIPSGRCGVYASSIGKQGAAKILNYIHKGGAYIGICAGAYYASRNIVYGGERRDCGIGLIDCAAIGPLSELAPVLENVPYDFINTVGVSSGPDEEFTALYHSGCSFTKVSKEVQILASYSKVRSPSAIQSYYGKGSVVLIGTHPDLTPEYLLRNSRFFKGEVEDHLEKCAKKLSDTNNIKLSSELSRTLFRKVANDKSI
ncbi:MAG: hypothetical protein CL512_05930 [Actinobacteria bacterium]|nr:hypothetical protein [Actinomycetota bacterium]